jgi:Lrp/AsnC family transcriptional regulator, leucine-responsive regulatory protein
MVMNEIDWKIIKILQKNARLSYAQIGREISLSPSAVGERIQKLEDEKIIKQYTSIIDYNKLGYSLSAYISIRFKDNGYKRFLNSLSDFPEIFDCSRITGKDCLIMKVVLKDNSHLENVVDRLIPFGVPSTSVVLSDVLSNGGVFF